MPANRRIFFVLLLWACLALAQVHADPLVKVQEPRRCYACEGINCLRASKVNDSKQCADEFDTCATVFDKSTVIAKGCFSDLPENVRAKCSGPQETRECLTCFDQLCNNKGTLKCIQCDENNDSKCASAAEALTPEVCDIPSTQNSYCFVSHVDGKVKRGCHTRMQDQMACMDDPKCSMCLSEDGEACNTFDLSNEIPPPPPQSGAKSLSGAAMTILSALLLVVCRLY